jgi:hypothetical protein
MGRARAAAGSILFLVVAPGVVAGLIPWLLTRWLAASPPGWVLRRARMESGLRRRHHCAGDLRSAGALGRFAA